MPFLHPKSPHGLARAAAMSGRQLKASCMACAWRLKLRSSVELLLSPVVFRYANDRVSLSFFLLSLLFYFILFKPLQASPSRLLLKRATLRWRWKWNASGVYWEGNPKYILGDEHVPLPLFHHKADVGCPGSSPALRSEKPVTNHQSHGRPAN
jgi:hypothetical protein